MAVIKQQQALFRLVEKNYKIFKKNSIPKNCQLATEL